MPRLSIIIPLRSDYEDFETTLVSVLENRPHDCEIIVAHDGSYDDPFHLAGEVCFAVGSDQSLLSLVRAAAQIVTSPIVHVLADGLQASPGWTDSIAELFDDSRTVCASPLIYDAQAADLILAAGWTTDSVRLRRRIAAGATAVGRLEAARIDGVFLAASFWRVGMLRQCLKPTSVSSTIGFESLCSRWIRDCDQQVRIATESCVTAFADSADLQTVGYRAGYQMQCAALSQEATATLGFALLGCFTQPHRWSAWMTAAGRVAAAAWGGRDRGSIARDLESISSSTRSNDTNEVPTLAFPYRETFRRAA